MNKKMLDRQEAFTKDCKWLFKKPIYHRGKFDNKNVYENTIEAYKLAVEDKSPFELDIRLTNDLQVICFHDNSLKRLFNKERNANDISYKRLNKIREDLQVPLLKDVLKLVNGKVELMIELKNINRKYNKILIEKVHDILKEYKGKYVIVSFNPMILRQYKKLDKNVYMGRIGCSENEGFFHELVVSKMYFSFLVKPDFISYGIKDYDVEILKKHKDKGYKITGWSLSSKENIKELKKYYDNFIIEGLEAKEI